MSLKQLMKLRGSSNIPRSAKQSWSKAGHLLKDNCNAESVFCAKHYGQCELMAMSSIISNYNVLHESWDWSLDNGTVTEIKARIRGVQVQMRQFEFFFGLVLGCNQLLLHTVSLSVWVCVCKESRLLQLKVYHRLS